MGRRGWCGGITGFAKQSRHGRLDMNEKVLKTPLLPGDRLYQRFAGDYAIIELKRDGRRERIYSIPYHGQWFGEGNSIFRELLTRLVQVGGDSDKAWTAERILEFDKRMADLKFDRRNLP